MFSSSLSSSLKVGRLQKAQGGELCCYPELRLWFWELQWGQCKVSLRHLALNAAWQVWKWQKLFIFAVDVSDSNGKVFFFRNSTSFQEDLGRNTRGWGRLAGKNLRWRVVVQGDFLQCCFTIKFPSAPAVKSRHIFSTAEWNSQSIMMSSCADASICARSAQVWSEHGWGGDGWFFGLQV